MIQTIDSDRRCSRCHKRMVMQIGQDDSTGAGDMRATHECWNCGRVETDKQWSRPLGTDPTGKVTRAERLRQLRLNGTVIPLVYDTTPFPKGEFDDVHPDAQRLDAR